MSYVPHVRDYVAVVSDSGSSTATLNVEPGDFLVGFGVNYSTTSRQGSFHTAGGLTGTDRWIMGGSASFATTWARFVSAQETLTFGPGVSCDTGTYGCTQLVVAFDNISHAMQYYIAAPKKNPDGSSSQLTYSGRPQNWASSTSAVAMAAGHSGWLHFGGELYTARGTTGAATPTPAGSSHLLTVDLARAWRHSSICLSWYDGDTPPASTSFGATASAGSITPGMVMLVTTTDSSPSPGPGTNPLTMGDGTPVTLEGWWDGTQLLPAEFVGLAE